MISVTSISQEKHFRKGRGGDLDRTRSKAGPKNQTKPKQNTPQNTKDKTTKKPKKIWVDTIQWNQQGIRDVIHVINSYFKPIIKVME